MSKENNDLEKEETSLERIEPKLEETEEYRQASFGEKLSLKFRKRLIANRFRTFILVILIIAVIVGINIWADKQNLAQIDLTENHLYSLTQTSKDQLKNLDKEVKIYIYGYTETDNYVQFVAQYAAFNNNISYELINESNNYELITKYGLGTYSAIVVVCGEKDRTIYPDYEFSSYDYELGDTIDTTEETLTNAILKVTTDDPIKVYFAMGNGEYTKSTLYSLSAFLEEEVYEVDDLNLLTITEMPSDCDILAIMAPEEDLTDSQAELIRNYVNNGGNLIVCSLIPNTTEFTNLQSILDLYGVRINKGLLYEGDNRYYLAYQNSTPLPYVLVPELSSESEISSDLSSSSNNQMVIMPWSQALTIEEVNEDNVTVESYTIATTSNNCFNVADYSKGITNAVLAESEKGQFTIGSELIRTVGSGEEQKQSKLIIYGNDSFILDTYKDGNVQISTMSQPGNINLIMNSFAELGEQENLITVRKAANVTDFKKTEAEDRRVKLIIFGVPVLIIILGIAIWNYRRKRR